MAIPVVCVHCGALFQSNIFGGPETGFTQVSVSNSSTNCPHCGCMTPIDGEYAVGKNQTVVLSAPWLFAFEAQIRAVGVTRAQGKRIQRKILKARDPDLLPDAIRQVSPQVADAVSEVVNQPASEQDKWQWLYRIAAVVGIVAGVNTFSSDYNIDAAIDWLRSQRTESADDPSASVAQDEPVNQTSDNEPRGPQ